MLKADGTVKNITPILEKLLAEPKCLKTDGSSLYLCIYYQQGLCDIYRCDTVHGNVALIRDMVNDGPLILQDGYAIIYDENEVNKLNIQTGQKQRLFSCDGELLGMTSYNDWILYITKPLNEDRTNINGYNLATCKTFEVELKGDYFYQTLPSEIIFCDSEHNDALSILTINGVKASFASLAT